MLKQFLNRTFRNCRSSRRSRRSRSAVEFLEYRTLLAANVIAQFHDRIAVAAETDTFDIHLDDSNFDIRSRHVTLGFFVSPGDDATLVANTAAVDSGRKGSPPVTFRETFPDGSSLVLAKVTHGDFSVSVSGANDTTGDWNLDIILAGDVNGDFAVDHTDHRMLVEQLGRSDTPGGFLEVGDINRNGDIDGVDVSMAARNRGVSTDVRVLDVSVDLDPADDSGLPADRLVNHSPVSVRGLTLTGAKVSLDADGDGFDDGTVVAGTPADGYNYSLIATIVEGTNALAVRAIDHFGQSAEADVSVTLDASAPGVVESVPGEGAQVDGRSGPIPVAIRFSEPMIEASVISALTVAGNQTTTITPTLVDYDEQTQTLTFSLSESLPDTAITVTVNGSAADIAGNALAGGEFRLQFDVIRETNPPVLNFGLSNDTGRSRTDRITSDPAVSGRILDESPVRSVLVGVDDDSIEQFVEAVEFLQPDGRVELSRPNLEQLLGISLEDGSRRLHFQATDVGGNVSDIISLPFVLDTSVNAPPLKLSGGSRAETGDPAVTNAAVVTLIGKAEPGARVNLNPPGVTSLVGSAGSVQFADVRLTLGDNVFSVDIVDAAGNSATTQAVIHRSEMAPVFDPVVLWNQAALEAIRLDATAPPVATRNLAMLGLSVFDVVSAVDGLPGYYVSLTPPSEMSLAAAVSGAAWRILDYVYPGQRAMLDSVMTDALARIPDGPAETSGVAFGGQVADAIIALRENDGWNHFIDYVPGNAVGDWQPTAPMYDVALLPQWAELTPFAMSSQQQFRPGGPPALDSPEYAADYEEVKQLGAASGSTRTDDQSEVARFWADGPGTYTPPGHWNHIALNIAEQSGYSLAATARLMAQLNVALADAAIVAWDSKYAYELWRPVDAIHLAAEDGNDQTTPDGSWESFVINPPFPEYVSGHSTFSGAAGEILTSLIGDDVSFSTSSFGLPGVERAFSSFEQAADEAGRSRVYGGIHFEFSNQDGLTSGRSLAQFVLEKFDLAADTQAPVVIVESPDADSVTNQAVTVTGRVVDNLSGVASLQYSLDGSSLTPITYDANGNFSIPISLPVDGSADGEHFVEFIATDVEGNVSLPVAVAFTLDTTAPAISIDTPTDGGVLMFDSRLAGVADPTNSTIAGLVYSFDGGAKVSILFDPDTGSFDSELDLGQLEVGSHTLSVTATDAAGNTATTSVAVSLADHIPFNVESILPAAGSGSVGSTFRPQVVFSRPVDPASLSSDNFYATDTTGAALPASIVPASDGTFAWLFFQNPMPGASTITLHVEGSTILAAADGELLDADGDGVPGGELTSQFTTVSLVPLPGTTLSGKVVGPGPDLKPMTYDDMRSGPDGMLHTPDDEFLHPIAGVRVFILGLENQVVYTNAAGDFHFDAVPSGTIKLAIDGTTATNAPAGFYFPEMVMDLEIEVGRDNTVMGTMGSREEKAANRDRQEAYLPRVRTDILQDVSPTEVTTIGVDAKSAPNLTAEQRAQLQIAVQPDSLVGPDGQPLASGQVGISTVPPELVREMLPPGLLQHTFDITVQAPGISNFSTPAPMTFPNLFGAAPGTKLNFLSFDHTTGRLVIEGTATVSENGTAVTTDPGTGIIHPGWHGLTPPGKCVEVADSDYILNQSNAQLVASGVYATVTGVEGILGTTNKLLQDSTYKTSFPTFPRTLGRVFSGFGIFQDIRTVFDSSGRYTVAQRYQAGFTALLNIALLTNPTGGLIVMAGRLASLALSFDGASTGLAHTALGIERKETDFQCQPSRNVPSPFSVSVSNQTVRAGLTAKTQDPILLDVEAALNNIASTLGQGDSDQLNLGLTSSQVAHIQNSLNQLESHVIRFDSQNPFWIDTDAIFQRVQPIAVGQSGGSGATVIRGPLPATRWTVDFSDRTISGDGRIEFVVGDRLDLSVYAYNAEADAVAYTQIDSGLGAAPIGKEILWRTTAGLVDTDLDGLVDAGELAVGTSVVLFDTDNDGIGDFDELRQGLDPLDNRGFPTGVVSSLDLMGEAREVVVEGNPFDAEEQSAFVATGSYGLAIVDASQFDGPIVLGQLDLAGEATDVAVDSRSGIAVVAAGSGGLHFVDVSNPVMPVLLRTAQINAEHVEIVEGVAYAAGGKTIRAYDVLTGERLDSISVGGGAFTDMAREGLVLYTMDSSRWLRAVDVSVYEMRLRGAIQLAEGAGRLFVGNDIAYAVAADSNQGGYSTVDVADPDNLMLISAPDVPNGFGAPGQAFAANGSGIGLLAGRPTFTNLNVLDVMDVSDPSETNDFFTRVTLPGPPSSMAIAAGLAFVAGGSSGLHVVNYLPFDNQGQSPTVTIDSSVEDIDLGTPGIQVLDGAAIPITAIVDDDVQVRNVELIVNGEVVANDVSFPFELTAIASAVDPEAPETHIEVRATDTGGNVALSNQLIIDLAADTFAPEVVRSTPADGQRISTFSGSIRIQFDEALDADTVGTSSFVLLNSSGDALTPVDIQLRKDDREVQVTYESFAEGEYVFQIRPGDITDRAGNEFGEAYEISFSASLATIRWTGASGGVWDDVDNWSGSRLPGPDDHVLIDVPGDATIEHRFGTTVVASILSAESFTLSGGTLTATDGIQVDQDFVLIGGKLLNSLVLPGLSGDLTVGTTIEGGIIEAGNTVLPGGPAPLLRGVILSGDLDLTRMNAFVMNAHDLTLNGTALFGTQAPGGAAYGVLQLVGGSQTLDGTGQLVFQTTDARNTLYPHDPATVLTIGPDITIRGGSGSVGYSTTSRHQSNPNKGIVNYGAVISDNDGGTIAVRAGLGWDNFGTIEAVNGGNLVLGGTWRMGGRLSVVDGGSMELGGAIEFPVGASPIEVGPGSVASITGVLDNTASSFDFTGGGIVGLNNGTLIGGTIRDGRTITAMSNGNNSILDGVTLDGDLDINGYRVFVRNDLTLNGTATLGGGNTFGLLDFSGEQSLLGTGEVVFAGTSENNTLWQIEDNSVLMIGPGITIRGTTGSIARGRGGIGGGSNIRVINQGTVRAENAGQTIYLNAEGGWVNQGTVEGVNGGNLWFNGLVNEGTVQENGGGDVDFTGDWSNAATLGIADGGQMNLGGNIQFLPGAAPINISAGSEVALTGVLDNNASTLDFTGGGVFGLKNGTLIGGTIQDGRTITAMSNGNNSILDGVTLDGDLDINGYRVFVRNGLTLNGTATLGSGSTFGLLDFSGEQSLLGTGEVVFAGTNEFNTLWQIEDNSVLTIGPGITVRGTTGSIGRGRGGIGGGSNIRVINQGTVRAENAGQTIYLNAEGGWVNQGTVEAQSGGQISTSGLLMDAGTLDVAAGGLISVFGNLAFGAADVLRVELAGTAIADYGRLQVSGNVVFAGTLDVRRRSGYSPIAGDSFAFLNYASRTGTFDTILGTDLGNGLSLELDFQPLGLVLRVL